jgi:hypothetical protein
MSKSLVLRLVVIVSFAATVTAGRIALRAQDAASSSTAVKSSLPALLAAEAERMIADYPDTRYSHKTHIDKSQGLCDVDCSGFIVTLLRHKAPEHLESIRTTHKRPLAEDFCAAFAPKGGTPARGWKPIQRLGDAERGDVLAWIKPDHGPGDNTGHVMLIAEKPVAESPRQFRVRIFDSTLQGHADDARTKSGRSGIGQGTLWFEVDDRMRPIGYRWKSKMGSLHEAPIAIGRAVAAD